MTGTMLLGWSILFGLMAAPESSTSSDGVSFRGQVTLIRDIQVPARQPGLLERLLVSEGQMVAEEELLANVDSSEAELRLEAARREYEAAAEQAKEDVKVQEARATADVAQAERDDSLAANRRSPGAVPETQLRREELTAQRAQLQVKVAEMEFSVAGLTAQAQHAKMQVIEHEIKTRQIRAPFAGLVAEIFRHEGEWVQAGDPVLRLVQMDRMRVEGFVDAQQVAPYELVGRMAEVRVELPGGRVHTVQAPVSYVGQIVDGKEFRVRVEIDNVPVIREENRTYWLLQPGLPAQVTIRLDRSR
ncbi:MAG: hemolysin D [Pirellulaceae bacterium]|nr:MAG: hemolysin D [Pirellulaceae bacterium]